MQRRQRRGWPPDLLRAFQDLADNTDLNAAGIREKLRAEFGEDVPSERTLRDWLHECRPDDRSGPWTLEDAEANDAREILDVLGAAAVASSDYRRSLTKDEARLALNIRRAAPSLPPFAVWSLVRLFLLRQSRPQPQNNVDDAQLFLALAAPQLRFTQDEAADDAHNRDVLDDFNAYHAHLWPDRLWLQPSLDRRDPSAAWRERAGDMDDLPTPRRFMSAS